MMKKVERAAVAVAAMLGALGLSREASAALVDEGTFVVGAGVHTSVNVIPEPPLSADGGEGEEAVPFYTIAGPGPNPAVTWQAGNQDFIFYNPDVDSGESGCPASVAAGSFAGCSDVVRFVNAGAGARVYFASDDDGSSFALLPGGAVPQPANSFILEQPGNKQLNSIFYLANSTNGLFPLRVVFRSDVNESTLASDSLTVSNAPAVPPVGLIGMSAALLGIGVFAYRRRRQLLDIAG